MDLWKNISFFRWLILRNQIFIIFFVSVARVIWPLRTDVLAIYLICSLFCTYCYFQNNRKRKQPTSSGPANSTGTGNTVGPSTNSPPSTPSTHMPGDGLGISGNMRHVPKNLMMYGADGTGLASSSNQMVRAFSLNLTPRCIVLFIWYGLVT